MFTGVINSREVRREKAASGSQSSGAASCRTSAPDAEVARLREEVANHDVYYANYIALQQSYYANHYATHITQQIQVSFSFCQLLFNKYTT